jgi:hypothetical protein
MKSIIHLTCILALWNCAVIAQEKTAKNPAVLSAEQKKETLERLITKVNDNYTFVAVAKKIESHLRQQAKENAYGKIIQPDEFARALTTDLRAVSHDKHLGVRYDPRILPPQEETVSLEISAADKENLSTELRLRNYGIRKIDVLKGNIGYLDIDFFCTPEFAGDTYAAAMNYLAHTDQLIIDLRRCGGSTSPDAIPFICSYFFENPVHLNDFSWRKDNVVNQSWTYAYVPGKKYLHKPIYILTSNGTFSGGEEIAYDLQNLKRATIIGQTTGGGANPGKEIRLSDHFAAFIPMGRAINPITKTNWEGVGVKPDSLVNSKLALVKAQEIAMQYTLKNSNDEGWKDAVRNWLTEVQQSKPVLKPVVFELKDFPEAKEVYVAGSFNDWSPSATKMEKQGNKWIVKTESEPGKVAYKFVVDGNWIIDPANDKKEQEGANTNSIKNVD